MYREIIEESLICIDRSDVDPRHAEAMIRIEHGTLNGLSRDRLHAEAKIAAACVDEAGPQMAERIAASFGL